MSKLVLTNFFNVHSSNTLVVPVLLCVLYLVVKCLWISIKIIYGSVYLIFSKNTLTEYISSLKTLPPSG